MKKILGVLLLVGGSLFLLGSEVEAEKRTIGCGEVYNETNDTIYLKGVCRDTCLSPGMVPKSQFNGECESGETCCYANPVGVECEDSMGNTGECSEQSSCSAGRATNSNDCEGSLVCCIDDFRCENTQGEVGTCTDKNGCGGGDFETGNAYCPNTMGCCVSTSPFGSGSSGSSGSGSSGSSSGGNYWQTCSDNTEETGYCFDGTEGWVCEGQKGTSPDCGSSAVCCFGRLVPNSSIPDSERRIKQGPSGGPSSSGSGGAGGILIPTNTGLPNPGGENGPVLEVLKFILSWLMRIFMLFAVASFVITGFQYIFALGNDISQAKRNFHYSLIAVAVVGGAMVIIRTIDYLLRAEVQFLF